MGEPELEGRSVIDDHGRNEIDEEVAESDREVEGKRREKLGAGGDTVSRVC